MAIYDTILFCSYSRARLQAAIEKNSLARFVPSLSLSQCIKLIGSRKSPFTYEKSYFSEEKIYKLACYVSGHLNQPGRLPLMDSQ
jgi:hypothetical protein